MRDLYSALIIIPFFCMFVSVYCRSRSTDPVCADLQTQILSCYRENRNQTLRCSDLAKEYMQCIDAAKKVSSLLKSGKVGLVQCLPPTPPYQRFYSTYSDVYLPRLFGDS